jgi:hypothetical protein
MANGKDIEGGITTTNDGRDSSEFGSPFGGGDYEAGPTFLGGADASVESFNFGARIGAGFGTAASSSVTTPIYGIQNEQQALVPQSAPPIFGFHITSVTSKRMSGKLIAPDSHKNVTMHR